MSLFISKIIKLKIYITIVLFLFNTPSFSEKYSCAYMWNGEPESITYERKGNQFYKSNQVTDDIVYEDDTALVLTSTYSYDDEPSTFTTLINKKKLNFVFIGLQYGKSTALVEGKCDVF